VDMGELPQPRPQKPTIFFRYNFSVGTNTRIEAKSFVNGFRPELGQAVILRYCTSGAIIAVPITKTFR
jgi:hypothetical protein